MKTLLTFMIFLGVLDAKASYIFSIDPDGNPFYRDQYSHHSVNYGAINAHDPDLLGTRNPPIAPVREMNDADFNAIFPRKDPTDKATSFLRMTFPAILGVPQVYSGSGTIIKKGNDPFNKDIVYGITARHNFENNPNDLPTSVELFLGSIDVNQRRGFITHIKKDPVSPPNQRDLSMFRADLLPLQNTGCCDVDEVEHDIPKVMDTRPVLNSNFSQYHHPHGDLNQRVNDDRIHQVMGNLSSHKSNCLPGSSGSGLRFAGELGAIHVAGNLSQDAVFRRQGRPNESENVLDTPGRYNFAELIDNDYTDSNLPFCGGFLECCINSNALSPGWRRL